MGTEGLAAIGVTGQIIMLAVSIGLVLMLAKEAGLHTAADTAGNVPFSSFEAVLPYVDVFSYDIKVWDSQRHKEATGVSNELILENLRKLTDAGASVFIRTPVIMEWNGTISRIMRFYSE